MLIEIQNRMITDEVYPFPITLINNLFSMWTEEMIRGLQQLGWKKVDVSFHSAFWPFFAHNNIHVLPVINQSFFRRFYFFVSGFSYWFLFVNPGEKWMAPQCWYRRGRSRCWQPKATRILFIYHRQLIAKCSVAETCRITSRYEISWWHICCSLV